jgi:hypothetical protein
VVAHRLSGKNYRKLLVHERACHDLWAGRRETTSCPERSPDLNLLDVYLMVLVHEAPVDKDESLAHCNVNASHTISIYPGIFEQILQSTMRNVQACI